MQIEFYNQFHTKGILNQGFEPVTLNPADADPLDTDLPENVKDL